MCNTQVMAPHKAANLSRGTSISQIQGVQLSNYTVKIAAEMQAAVLILTAQEEEDICYTFTLTGCL
jgi:hypothetical protein